MKMIFTLSVLFVCIISFSQPNTQPLTRSAEFLGNTAQDLVYDRAKIYLNDQVYLIDGVKVVGTPFLYRNWYNGSVTTADGRVYSGYKFKYNVYNQTVSFFNGTDSLEINEEIKEFSLLVPDENNELKKYSFINASGIKKDKSSLYFEVIVDHAKGQLLKVNRKFIEEGHNGLPVHEGKKIFGLEVEYYFYDHASKKITRIKGNGSNLSQILTLTDEDESLMKSMDFNKEEDIAIFFQKLFRT